MPEPLVLVLVSRTSHWSSRQPIFFGWILVQSCLYIGRWNVLLGVYFVPNGQQKPHTAEAVAASKSNRRRWSLSNCSWSSVRCPLLICGKCVFIQHIIRYFFWIFRATLRCFSYYQQSKCNSDWFTIVFEPNWRYWRLCDRRCPDVRCYFGGLENIFYFRLANPPPSCFLLYFLDFGEYLCTFLQSKPDSATVGATWQRYRRCWLSCAQESTPGEQYL